MGGFLHVGPGLAKGRQRGIDHAGIARPHLLVADAQAIDHAGPEGLDHHIGALSQAQGHLQTMRMLEVELHAFLAAMGIGEIHRHAVALGTDLPVRFAAVGGFELDHLGAVIGHHLGQCRAGQEQGQIENLDAFEFHPLGNPSIECCVKW